MRVLDADGQQVGVMPLEEAIRRAEEAGLDLVEVAASADPPVCRIVPSAGRHRLDLYSNRLGVPAGAPLTMLTVALDVWARSSRSGWRE